jgi:lipoate-protein ligase A
MKLNVFHPSLRRYSDFVKAATNPSNKTQIYLSRTLDPYVNLSIEHYLLQKTPAESTVLFLYTDRPCVVLGRNQNPWVEVNLGLLKSGPLTIDLVRRRSGGGTVFHDEGNVNYSVICPTPAFHRDKHAEMVVRALHKLGVEKTKVNERHDIVLDSGGMNGKESRQLKVSGSAYKLTRLRSLHHGTCLLSSPNLGNIGEYLRSPAKPYIKARGVESVSSPITNVNVANDDFEQAVISEFVEMYGSAKPMVVTESAAGVAEVWKGLEEMRTSDWIFSQTPQFTFSAQPSEGVRSRAWHSSMR